MQKCEILPRDATERLGALDWKPACLESGAKIHNCFGKTGFIFRYLNGCCKRVTPFKYRLVLFSGLDTARLEVLANVGWSSCR